MSPRDFEFYIPQLTNFLLQDTSPKGIQLECFLLDKSERCAVLSWQPHWARLLTPQHASPRSSLRFAHRLWWFLRAFHPDATYSSELCGAVRRDGLLSRTPLQEAVEQQGVLAARRLLAQGASVRAAAGVTTPSRRALAVLPAEDVTDAAEAVGGGETGAGLELAAAASHVFSLDATVRPRARRPTLSRS